MSCDPQTADEVLGVIDADQRIYVNFAGHRQRHLHTLALLRRIVQPDMRLVDVASCGVLLPALKGLLGLRDVTVTILAKEGAELHGDLQLPALEDGTVYNCFYDRVDVETPFPYSNESFDVAIFTEVLEHLTRDPMHTLGELNRITKLGGWLLLSTPNCASTGSLIKTVRGQHPYLWAPYCSTGERDRHNREYVPSEVMGILESAGYDVVLLETCDVYSQRRGVMKRCMWHAIERFAQLAGLILGNSIAPSQRGDTIFGLARKVEAVRQRYPGFLYYSKTQTNQL